jgi:hypothetical protein
MTMNKRALTIGHTSRSQEVSKKMAHTMRAEAFRWCVVIYYVSPKKERLDA